MGNAFLYILELAPKYRDANNWTNQTQEIIQLHFEYLTNLFQQKKVSFVGRTNYTPEHPDLKGYVVIATSNKEEAEQIMQNDPCVSNWVMEARLHPFNAVFPGIYSQS